MAVSVRRACQCCACISHTQTSPRAPSLASSELVQLLHEQLQEVVVCEGGVLCLAFRVTLREWEYGAVVV
jgi:hypothetical protein